MFGYVLPRMDKLSETDSARYKAAYCGLCRSLKLNYGFRARFLVNYDMTFLYFLLHDGAPEQAEKCGCPARPFCKKDCLPCDGTMRYAADLTVLFSFWKLRDAKTDGRFFRTAGARLAALLYKKCFKCAAKRLPALNDVFAAQLERLQSLETESCASIDRAADSFAQMLCQCAAFFGDADTKRAAELLLYHVGRYLYLVDALEDLPKDNQGGSYNPLRYRYVLHDGTLSEEDKAQFLETVEASVSMAASALELLPIDADRNIVTNIIYFGLPAVLSSVADGTFRKRRRRRRE